MTLPLRKLAGLMICVLILNTPALAQQTSQQPANNGYTPPQQRAQTPQTSSAQQEIQQATAVAAPQMPPGFPLPAAEQEYIEKLLGFWEGTSSQIELYECDFTRWQYDHEICNYRKPENNHLVAAMISRGKVRYSTPDKGMYEINEMWLFDGAPDKPGGNPKYIRPAATNPEYIETEKWVCDGKGFYEYDYRNKRLGETILPPEAQGEGLKNSPLPFVFGARTDELLKRFWIRDITPERLEGKEYWLEAWPKTLADAQAYRKVDIILSREPFLPISIHMYAPNYDEKTNPAKMVFQFDKRQINGGLAQIKGFMNNFINPRTPLGWDRVSKKLYDNDQASNPQNPRMGQLPAGEAGAEGR